jgi:hypothetical protein
MNISFTIQSWMVPVGVVCIAIFILWLLSRVPHRDYDFSGAIEGMMVVVGLVVFLLAWFLRGCMP